jgi:hypothetical protein
MKLKAILLGAMLSLMSPPLWALAMGLQVREVGTPTQYKLLCLYEHDADDWLLGQRIWFKCATFTNPLPQPPANGTWPSSDPLGVPPVHQYLHYFQLLAITQTGHAHPQGDLIGCGR